MFANNFQKPTHKDQSRAIPEHLTPYEASKYKTVVCWNYANGTCKFGPKCKFAHGAHELRHYIEPKEFHPKLATTVPRLLCLDAIISDEAHNSVKHCSTNVGHTSIADLYAILKESDRDFEVDESSTLSDEETPKQQLTQEQIVQFRAQDTWSSFGTNYDETLVVEEDLYLKDYEDMNNEPVHYETKYGMIHIECEKPVLRRTESCPVLG
jgi:hypothetical protein